MPSSVRTKSNDFKIDIGYKYSFPKVTVVSTRTRDDKIQSFVDLSGENPDCSGLGNFVR